MRKIQLLPNLITLGNAFCGLLAMSKAIDALAHPGASTGFFYARMEQACMLVFLSMILDALDGFVARLTKSASEIGAQLDSFADAVTFGVTPAVLALVLLAHEGPAVGYDVPRLHILAAASFPLLAILRLARFNLEPDDGPDKHAGFRGLPSPAAAGAVASTIWLYLILRRPELEQLEGTPTPLRRVLGWMEIVDWRPILDWMPVFLVAMLPIVGILMVSNVRYVHAISYLAGKGQFFTLVGVVLAVFMIYIAPVPFLFVFFTGYALAGMVLPIVRRRRASGETATGS
jgi:CDP-diacylglycerol--serine O-phosphatidyltransferase